MTSPNNKRSATEPDAGQSKTARTAIKQFTLFKLHDGGMKMYDDLDLAMHFQTEYDSIISSSLTFETKSTMEAYHKAHKHEATPTAGSPARPSTSSAGSKDMSPEEKESFHRLRDLMESEKPAPKHNCYWKTTPMTNKVLVVWKPVDVRGQDAWYIKTPFHKCVIYYSKERKATTEQVQQFFDNMDTAKQRDLDKGPHECKVNYSKDKKKEFPQNIYYTHFDLNFDTLKNARDEQAQINNVITMSMDWLRKLVNCPLFMSLIKSQYSDKMYHSMTREDAYGGNLHYFLTNAKTKPIRMENLNTHVILADANEMKMFLAKSEASYKKYPVGTDHLYADQLIARGITIDENAPSDPSTSNAVPPDNAEESTATRETTESAEKENQKNATTNNTIARVTRAGRKKGVNDDGYASDVTDPAE